VGLGEARGEEQLEMAFKVAPGSWMVDSTREQINKLRELLADSPLKHIRTEAA
jgi:hypothetical protein